MRVWLDPTRSWAHLELDRPRRDFGERDRDVLDALLPHLTQFRRRAVARRSPPPTETAFELTLREREILQLAAHGKTNAEIAALLWISSLTVRKHLENVFAKLGVHTRTAAVAAVASRYFLA